ncbi:hypothetical protein [Streptomyces odontomachi]|uniref:hypothetical protein n=1 Tax=Streptomyces odontomachi TaxID=2944940 RepID=UPI00210CDEF5|nr:hypothetical protein [Streptomyces sp. ODS25]
MTAPRRTPWVGDQVHDTATDRAAIITDVQHGSTYLLRPPHGAGPHWTTTDPTHLTVTIPREQRRAEDRI